MRRLSPILLLHVVAACVVVVHITAARAQDITARPPSVDLGFSKPGSHTHAELELINESENPLDVEISTIAGAFTAKPDTLTIPASSRKTVLVEFAAPAKAGAYSSTLSVKVKSLLGDKLSIPLKASVVQPRLVDCPRPIGRDRTGADADWRHGPPHSAAVESRSRVDRRRQFLLRKRRRPPRGG